MKKAKAAVFTTPRAPFEIREFPVPSPGPDQILVKPLFSNICGTDLHIWRGEMGFDSMGVVYPLILGHEMVAEVVEAGERRPFQKGDTVTYQPFFHCGQCRPCQLGREYACLNNLSSVVRNCEDAPHFVGGFAQYYLVEAGQPAYKLPEGLPPEIASAANCAVAQVIFGFERAEFRYGETVVIQGAGGLGLYSTCLAKEMGASKIIVIDALPARLELAKAFGADEVIDASVMSDAKERTFKVLEWTGNWGADMVVEVAGIPDIVPEGIRMLTRGGRYLELGNISPRRTYKADPSLLVGGNRSIIGVSCYPAESLAKALQFLAKAHRKYPLARMTRTFPFDQIDRAFAAADAFGREKTEVVRASICLT